MENALLIGSIVQLCAREDDTEMLDLVFKLLASNAKEVD